MSPMKGVLDKEDTMNLSTVIAKFFIFLILLIPFISAANNKNTNRALSEFNSASQSIVGRGLNDRQKGEIIERKYLSEFYDINNKFNLSQLSDSDILGYFDATYTTAFYSLKYFYIEKLRGIYSDLARRGINTNAQQHYIYDMLIATRHFEEAKTLRDNSQYYADRPLPYIRPTGDKQQPGAWEEADHGNTITYTPINIAYYSVIIVAHPLCHFSQDAFKAITANKELQSFFSRYAIILTPQEGNLNLSSIALWNERYPSLRMRLVDDQSYWPGEINNWSTPAFYFFHDGKFIGSVIGWPPEGRTKELIALINATKH